MRRLLALAMIGLACTAIPVAADEPAATDGPAAVSAGLSGRVVLALRCPVPLGGDDSPCPQPPLPSTLTIRSADGLSQIAQLATDQDGQFAIDLDPGDYLVDVAAGTSRGPLTDELAVTIGEDGPTLLTIGVRAGAARQLPP
jgi:hypothetical protein